MSKDKGRVTPEMFWSFQVVRGGLSVEGQELGRWGVHSGSSQRGGKGGGQGELCMRCTWEMDVIQSLDSTTINIIKHVLCQPPF